MNVLENIRKTMGWCPQVSTGTARILTPEVDIKNLGVPELKREKFCSGGIEIIAIAVIWASVILAISSILDGTPYMSRISPILSGGAFASILILYNLRKKKREK
jgi:hypothetical protein